MKHSALQCSQNLSFLFLPSLLSLALSNAQDHPNHHLHVKPVRGGKSCVSGFCLGSRYSFQSLSFLRSPCEGHRSVLRAFTSSGEWDDCNYLSLKIIRVCFLGPERRSISLGAHGSAEEWKKKYRSYWREEMWHNEGRENEFGVGAQ